MSDLHIHRSHTCGEIRKDHMGQTVKLTGWVHRVRDMGGIVFIDLRDRYGITQVVVDPSMDFHMEVNHWRLESVVEFTGEVLERNEETVNKKLETGEVELHAKDMKLISEAKDIPFSISTNLDMPEHIRLKYRYIDLRKEDMQKNILTRSKVISSLRRRMEDHGFNEFQTPILTASSPEGARDFLVPSRLHPGKFYALPQAPQQFKQLLMVAGFDRYFQIAPCFRDEDARADRSPGEFYQLDIEMACATQDDVFEVVEDVVGKTFETFTNYKYEPNFVRIPYAEACLKYGGDKPDLRNPLFMVDITEAFRESEFTAFSGVVKKGGVVRAIRVKGHNGASKGFHERMIKFTQSVGGKGLGYLIFNEDEVKSPITKFLTGNEIPAIQELTGAEIGDVVYFIADKEKVACSIGSNVLRKLGEDLKLVSDKEFKFCWIVDYPMYEYNEEKRCIEFSHNPFSMPQGGPAVLDEKDPLEIKAWQYDLVCNGIELSSGAVRNYCPDTMIKAFGIAGYAQETVEEEFSGMINAFRAGAPPHAGIAPGVDRMVMLILGRENIREIIAFPMNGSAQDLMMNAPSEVDDKQLKELSLNIKWPKKVQIPKG